jgi:DNA-binding PadR family transcriptional regulator
MRLNKKRMKELLSKAKPKLPRQEVREIGDRVWHRLEAEMEERKEELSVRSLYGDGWNVPALDHGDFQILTAASQLKDPATPATILRTIEKWTDRPPVIRMRLEQLEERGFVASDSAGGQGQRRYQVTDYGQRALIRAKLEGKQPVTVTEAVAEESRERDWLKSESQS